MLRVVVASDVLVSALSSVDPDLVRFPEIPPATGNPPVDVVGVFVRSGDDFALCLDLDILTEVAIALEDLGWSATQRAEALSLLADLAVASSGTSSAAPARGVQVAAATTSSTTALRCAASPDLGDPAQPRVVVVDASAGLPKHVVPHGVPWPEDHPLVVVTADSFRALVERVRLRMRPA